MQDRHQDQLESVEALPEASKLFNLLRLYRPNHSYHGTQLAWWYLEYKIKLTATNMLSYLRNWGGKELEKQMHSLPEKLQWNRRRMSVYSFKRTPVSAGSVHFANPDIW